MDVLCAVEGSSMDSRTSTDRICDLGVNFCSVISALVDANNRTISF